MRASGASWPRPWTCEDGGPRRLGAPVGQAGIGLATAARATGDRLVVLDLDTGAERGSCAVPSAGQAYLFPAPGWDRDLYYQSLTTIARVAVAVGG